MSGLENGAFTHDTKLKQSRFGLKLNLKCDQSIGNCEPTVHQEIDFPQKFPIMIFYQSFKCGYEISFTLW
jgi:hypothetical protein